MITICNKCENRRVHWFFDCPDRCIATEFKETNYVTGKVTSRYSYCHTINTSGSCMYFMAKDEKNVDR